MEQTKSAPPPKAAAQPVEAEHTSTQTLASLTLDTRKGELSLSGSAWVVAIFAIIAVILFCYRVLRSGGFSALEIDETEIGVGPGKVKLKPNSTDRQVAYQIWVELSTRKIGLDIDLDHDVVAEVYDSWYHFFGVTRDLIKSVPVEKVRSKSTRRIINLSIEVLNLAIRPHLTRWQARYRRWYDREIQQESTIAESPQELQKRFPQYDELSTDMMKLNGRLKTYRSAMHDLVYKSL